MAKPADRLKLGKALLKLKKFFPHDKMLRKMIIYEFRYNKISKYPGEYDIYDSDEEDRRKGNDTNKYFYYKK